MHADDHDHCEGEDRSAAGRHDMLRNEASVKGGEAQGGGEPPPASSVQPVTVNAAPTPFGVQAQGFELEPFNEDGTPAGLAGSHPFQLTSLLVMNQTGLGSSRQPVALPKDLRFDLPPGLVGDPNAVEQCPLTEFFAHELEHTSDLCRPGSVVGVAAVTIDEPLNTRREHVDGAGVQPAAVGRRARTFWL